MSLKSVLPLIVLMAFVLGCSEDNSTLDPALSDSPIIFTDMELSHYLVDTDTVSVITGDDKTPDDDITIPLKVTVHLQRRTAGGSGATLRCVVSPDGGRTVIADKTIEGASTGQYTFDMDLDRHRGDVGDYSVEVTGQEGGDGQSAVARANLRVVYGSYPPVILAVNMPDTLDLPSEIVTFVISAQVSDPSGPKDIKRVQFSSFKPNGSGSEGNPFELLDDGLPSSGDETAEDGWYSLRVQLPSTAQKGEYEFQFRAFDYSNTASKIVIHKLIVR